MLHSALPPAEDLELVPLADIARGGMGIVQLCRVVGGRLDGRALAVKRLNPAIEQEPEFVNMFLDETWITKAIESPHVVKVEAWGRDDNGMFLAVELVEGVSLSRLMKESKEKKEPFAERTVANIASQLCGGLTAAHELRGENGSPLSLVHRDLTPGNVLCGFDGTVKIADFGIAKAEERLTSTRIGMMKGKPAYMAPEQARGGVIDARADLFALGVVMFELLADRRPWLGTNDLETLVNVSTKDPPNLRDIRRVSPVFVEIVEKCLKKNPDERFSSAREIGQLLHAWRAERGFIDDDRASLSAFVERNTQQQMAWFAQALSGELSRGGVTFKDLEAKIDQHRKKADTFTPHPSAANPRTPSQHLPAPSAAAQGRPPELDEIDDAAQTRFMPQQNSSPAATTGNPAAGSLPDSPKTGPSLSGTLAMTDADAVRLMSRVRGQVAQDPRANHPIPIQHTSAPPGQLSIGIGSAHFLAATDSMEAPVSSGQLPPIVGAPYDGLHGYPPTQPAMPMAVAGPTRTPSSSGRTILLSLLLALVLAAVSFAVVYFFLSPRAS
jgi:serine/threonine protein kinase